MSTHRKHSRRRRATAIRICFFALTGAQLNGLQWKETIRTTAGRNKRQARHGVRAVEREAQCIDGGTAARSHRAGEADSRFQRKLTSWTTRCTEDLCPCYEGERPVGFLGDKLLNSPIKVQKGDACSSSQEETGQVTHCGHGLTVSWPRTSDVSIKPVTRFNPWRAKGR